MELLRSIEQEDHWVLCAVYTGSTFGVHLGHWSNETMIWYDEVIGSVEFIVLNCAFRSIDKLKTV